MQCVLNLMELYDLSHVCNFVVIGFVWLMLIQRYLANGFVRNRTFIIKNVLCGIFLGESRSLKALCRLTIRRYLFNNFNDGFKRLSSLELNHQLYDYLMFKKQS